MGGGGNVGIEIVLADKKLNILVVAHLTIGVVTGLLAQVEVSALIELEHILIVPFFASVLCQAFLLSLWGTASQARLWKRLAGLVAGAMYLEALLAAELRMEFLGIIAITIAVTSASLLVVRWVGVGFRRLVEVDQPARFEPEGLKFSIRDIMTCVAAVALLCAGARAMQASPQRRFLLTLVWAICFVAVGLVSMWAAFGDARLKGRVPVVFVLSFLLAVFFAFAAVAHKAGWVYILLIMVLYPAALLGSLLVVRSCGYRLERSGVAFRGRAEERGRSVGSLIP
jgi:hypothetical protein